MTEPPGALVGKEVTVSGLKSKPELNGKVGVAQSYVPQSERYVVDLPGEQSLALKADNLTLVDSPVGKDVVVTGLASKPELNGLIGKVQSFVVESQRYVVALTDGVTLALKVSNLEVPSKERLNKVRIDLATAREAGAEAAKHERVAAAKEAQRQARAAAIAAKKAEEKGAEETSPMSDIDSPRKLNEAPSNRQREADKARLQAALFDGEEEGDEGSEDEGELCETGRGVMDRAAREEASRQQATREAGHEGTVWRSLGWGAKHRVKP